MTPRQITLSKMLVAAEWWDLNPSTMPWPPFNDANHVPEIRPSNGIRWIWVAEAEAWLPDLDDGGTTGILWAKLQLQFPENEIRYEKQWPEYGSNIHYIFIMYWDNRYKTSAENLKTTYCETFGGAVASALLGIQHVTPDEASGKSEEELAAEYRSWERKKTFLYDEEEAWMDLMYDMPVGKTVERLVPIVRDYLKAGHVPNYGELCEPLAEFKNFEEYPSLGLLGQLRDALAGLPLADIKRILDNCKGQAKLAQIKEGNA